MTYVLSAILVGTLISWLVVTILTFAHRCGVLKEELRVLTYQLDVLDKNFDIDLKENKSEDQGK